MREKPQGLSLKPGFRARHMPEWRGSGRVLRPQMGAGGQRAGSSAGNVLPKTSVGPAPGGPFGSLDKKEGFSVALGK